MNNTPRTDIMASGNSDPSRDEYEEMCQWARRLERELNQERIWKEEDPRMLREQMRVHDVAFQNLHDENKSLKSKVEELERERNAYKSSFEQEECKFLAAEKAFEAQRHSLSQHQAALREGAEALKEAVLFDVVLPSEVITGLNKAISTAQSVLKEGR